MQKDTRVCVVGKVFRPNERKILALNRCLSGYLRLIRWHLPLNNVSKTYLHRKGYGYAREDFEAGLGIDADWEG